jgi:hypothetical protein
MTKKYYSYEETHRTVSGRKQKLCTKCIKWKDKREFHKDRYRKDGLKIRCKECDKADAHERRRKNRRKRKNVRQYLRYEQRHRTIRGVKQKLCCSCNKWKDESHYSRHRQLKDGLSLKCKDCERKRYARKRLEQKKKVREGICNMETVIGSSKGPKRSYAASVESGKRKASITNTDQVKMA